MEVGRWTSDIGLMITEHELPRMDSFRIVEGNETQTMLTYAIFISEAKATRAPAVDGCVCAYRGFMLWRDCCR